MKKKLALTLALCGTSATALAQNANTASATDQGSELQEVVVTGTLIRGVAPTGQTMTTVDNAAIQASGTTNTADLLATQPALNSFNIAPQGGQSEFNSGGSSTPGLHGLPGTATLVLVDGHRLVGDTPLLNVPDPSSIPPSAIDHIEIIADGGSAIYGSDAIAGVINIILRKNFNGAESSVSYAAASAYNTAELSQTFGKTWSGGSALLALTYENNSDLKNTDRSFYMANLTSVGGQDTRGQGCEPPNVTIAGVSYAGAGLLKGPAQSCDTNLGADLFNQNRRYGLMANLRQDFADRVHMFVDAKYTDDRQVEAIGADTVSSVIPSTNPFFQAPAGVVGATSETVTWNTSVLGGLHDIFTSRSGMFDIGADIDIWHGWQLSTDFDYSWSSSSTLNPDNGNVNAGALAAAIASTDPKTALDPFGPNTNPNIAAGILNSPLYFYGAQRLYDFNLKVDGSVFTLPGGDVKVALGVGNRHEEYNGSDPIGVPGQPDYNNNYESATRVINSAFGELSLPIVGAGNQMPGVERLTVSVAGRYDRYSDFGSTSNPKYGIDWVPVNGVKLRASYGTSYHAPQLADLYGIDTRSGYFQFFAQPPGYSGPPLPGSYIAGGHSNLKAETAKTASFGVDFTPEALPGFRASLTYFMIRFTNEVQIPPFGSLFSVPELEARFVYLNPTGNPANPYAPLTQAVENATLAGIRLQGYPQGLNTPLYEILDARRANIGSTAVDGWDFDFSYHHPLPVGNLLAELSGSWLTQYESNEGPGTHYTSNLTNGDSYQTSDTSAYNVIAWHARAQVGWQVGDFATQGALNYTGHYDFGYQSTSGATLIQWVDPFVTIDWNASYSAPATSGFAKGTKVQLNMYNLLNTPPPLVIQAGGFAAESSSPLGRLVRVTLSKSW